MALQMASSSSSGLLAAGLSGTHGVGLALVAGGQGYTYLEELRAAVATARGEDGSLSSTSRVGRAVQAIAAALAEEVQSAEGVTTGCW